MSDTPDVDVSLIPRRHQAQLPTPQPTALISHEDGEFVVTHPVDGIYVTDTLHESCKMFEYYVFDASVYKLGKRVEDALLFNESDKTVFYSPRTVEKILARVSDSYRRAKDRYTEWLDSTNDLATAWDFVSEHPAYWRISGGVSIPSSPLVRVVRQPNTGEALVVVENGSLIASRDSTDHFAAGEGATFEEAVIEHARATAKRYFWDGSPKPLVDGK